MVVEALFQISCRAQFTTRFFGFSVACGRVDEHRNVPEVFPAFDLFQKLNAAHAGHVDVHHNNVGFCGAIVQVFKGLQGREAKFENRKPSASFDGFMDKQVLVRIVVNNKYSFVFQEKSGIRKDPGIESYASAIKIYKYRLNNRMCR